jgi:uncharacterized membrane protein YphA (DoxX/SURF4 family)
MMSGLLSKVITTDDSRLTIIIRIMVGAVFLSEGIQKFLYASSYGAGRFEKIGLPAPEIMGPFVGAVEIVSGMFILAGFLTRFWALQTLIIMSVALFTTKVPILLGEGFWGLNVRELSRYGFWAMAHEMRTDWAMWLGSLFLILAGAGRWSCDRLMMRTREGDRD